MSKPSNDGVIQIPHEVSFSFTTELTPEGMAILRQILGIPTDALDADVICDPQDDTEWPDTIEG